MGDKREIKRIPKVEVGKLQADSEYKFRRNAVGMIRAFAELYPDDFDRIVEEIKHTPRHSEPLVKFDL